MSPTLSSFWHITLYSQLVAQASQLYANATPNGGPGDHLTVIGFIGLSQTMESTSTVFYAWGSPLVLCRKVCWGVAACPNES